MTKCIDISALTSHATTVALYDDMRRNHSAEALLHDDTIGLQHSQVRGISRDIQMMLWILKKAT